MGIVCVAGCSTQPHPGPQGDGSEPHACAMTASLDGTTSTPAAYGPAVLGASGVDLCLHLDATKLRRAHFGATASPATKGTTQPFLATLEDSGGTPILDSWDVTVGQTDPTTFMNLEWSPPIATTDVILWVRGNGNATISLSLIDPIE